MKWQGQGESDNVEDRRGSGGRKTPLAIGGGLIGTIVVIVGIVFFGVDLRDGAPPPGGNNAVKTPGQDDEDKHFAASMLKFTDEVWTEEFKQLDRRYEKPHMVLFDGSVDTQGCGSAPSAVGPFYCPADKTVYLDPSFFDELQTKLGGSKAKFSQAYVIAHEVGHHVQNLLGYNIKLKKFEKFEGKNASIRLELQADYLAGVWAYHGQKKYKFIEPGDVDAALKTARAIGDDRLMKKAGRWPSPESFTHGSEAQRLKWFKLGMEQGDKWRTVIEKFFDANVPPLKL